MFVGMPQQKNLELNTKPFRCLVVRCWLLVARRAFMPGTHPCLNPSQALVCRGRPVQFPDDGNDAAQVAQGAPVVRPWLKRGGLPAPAVGARGGPRGGHAGAHPVEGEAGQVLPAAALHRRARRNRGLAEHPGRLQVLHRIPSPCHNSMGRPEPSRVRVRRSEGLWNRQIFLKAWRPPVAAVAVVGFPLESRPGHVEGKGLALFAATSLSQLL
mmetsp:Transcript_20898/g.47135  ORF Transcript_20898/g.47135 Transcript_20898/m.47135 type:complete len:213 (-) Transcript_20898:1892-2530(-)